MGCFLACFGCSKNKKRRKHANKIIDGGQRFGSYRPLDSSAKDPITTSNSDKRNKAKEKLKTKKKVSFNLNVQSYEPIAYDQFLESEDEDKSENEPASPERPMLTFERDDSSYPSNYRYKNCRDSYDDEDEMLSADSDMEDYYDGDDDIDDEDEYYEEEDEHLGDEGQILGQKEISDHLNSARDKGNSRETDINSNIMHAPALQEPKATDLTRNARDRSQYTHSVLNPVENISQWKAIKAKPRPQLMHQRQENVGLEPNRMPSSPKLDFHSLPCNYSEGFAQFKPMMQDIAVDASLSSWVVSSKSISATQSSNNVAISMPLK